jgi:hypothetical protein
MDLIEPFLRRLRKRVSRFVAPSAALRNARLLKAQIELRVLALKDIQTICRKLRPLTRRPLGRSRISAGRVRRSY